MTLAIIYAIFYLLAGFLAVTAAFKVEAPDAEDRVSLFMFGWVFWPLILVAVVYVLLKHFLTRYINFIVK